MANASSNAPGTPALVKDTPPANPLRVFDWYQNDVQKGLDRVYRADVAQRGKILGIMKDLTDADLFWDLVASYEDIVDDRQESQESKRNALFAFAARIYIAGTERGAKVLV